MPRRTGSHPRGPRDLRSHRALLGLAALGVAGEARRGLVGCHVAPDGSAAVFGQWISDLQWSSPRGRNGIRNGITSYKLGGWEYVFFQWGKSGISWAYGLRILDFYWGYLLTCSCLITKKTRDLHIVMKFGVIASPGWVSRPILQTLHILDWFLIITR